MERQIGIDHWTNAIYKMINNSILKHCFAKGTHDSSEPFDPNSILTTPWEYVVERWPEGIVCVTYNFGKKVNWVVHLR